MNHRPLHLTMAMGLFIGLLCAGQPLPAPAAESAPPAVAAKPAPPAAAAKPAPPGAAAKPAPSGAAAKPAAGDGKELPNLDVKSMTPSEQESLRHLLEKFPSACGKPHSLLTSLRTDPKCALSPVAARWIQKLLSEGYLESEVEDKYTARFLNSKCYDIDISGASVRGDPKAPVTIVEFSDFECPHCRMAEPWLKQALEEYPRVKLVFMNFPLSSHPNAANAAAAAIAAGKQNKFWAYHDKIFENQDKLRPADLLRYAQELKLDVKRFQADLEAARPRVQHERSLGEKLDIRATPTFFINCRKAEGINSVDTLRSYIEAELAK